MFTKQASKYDVEKVNFTLFFNFILPVLVALAAILTTIICLILIASLAATA